MYQIKDFTTHPFNRMGENGNGRHRCLFIPAVGPMRIIYPLQKIGTRCVLEDHQALVDGSIEIVSYNNFAMTCNDNGLNSRLPVNFRATKLNAHKIKATELKAAGRSWPVGIVGDVFIVGNNDHHGWSKHLSQKGEHEVLDIINNCDDMSCMDIDPNFQSLQSVYEGYSTSFDKKLWWHA